MQAKNVVALKYERADVLDIPIVIKLQASSDWKEVCVLF